MPIYRMSEPGVFRLFRPTEFGDLESKLEDWVEANPHLLFPGETIVFIGRQTMTAFGKQLDLLGLDQNGATIVVELKRGLTPREVVAQTLEYAAWVDSLELDELDGIAKTYVASQGKVVNGVLDLYRDAFGAETAEPEEATESAARVTFNVRQRMVIVAEEFLPELEQTLHYLRTKAGVDIAGVRFGIHRLEDDILIETETVVGRETRSATANKAAAPQPPETPEVTRARVQSQFVRDQVGELEAWIGEAGGSQVEVHRGGGSNRSVYLGGKWVFSYYFALRWLHFALPMPGEDDLERVRQLGPDKVSERGNRLTINVATPADLELVRPLLEGQLRSEREPPEPGGSEIERPRDELVALPRDRSSGV